MKPLIKMLMIFVSLTAWLNTSSASLKEDTAEELIKTYGALSQADHPLVSKAQNVFEKVLAAADKRTTPRLIILRKTGEPWAMALKDGSVILTQVAMEFCYKDTDEEIGSSRLAFVLGHELAHLAKDDFWHLTAFDAVQKFIGDKESDKKAAQEICRLLLNTEDIIRKKELQADSYGLLYATMASYDPNVIVNSNGKNFFQEWADQTIGKIAYTDNSHPDPEQRAVFVLSYMNAVKTDIELFNFGVRLYQLGKYKDALAFLEAFNQRFPCREVYNNIGLVHYQMAMESLAEYDPKTAYRFKLPAILDTETRASILRKDTDIFQREIRDAVNHFKIACEKDVFYVPARINLSSAYIMMEKYSDAMAILDEALKIRENDPQALNNRAIAMYLLGPSINADMFKQATDTLKNVIRDNPEFSDTYYNSGRIQAERERNAGAAETWNKYLELESDGVYAEMVKDSLKIEKNTVVSQNKISPAFIKPSPVKLGDVDNKTEKQLAGLSQYTLNLKSVFGEYYVGNGIRVLVLDGVVELVESPARQNISLSKVISRYGNPSRILTSTSGTKTLVYENFALDVKEDIITREIYFKDILYGNSK